MFDYEVSIVSVDDGAAPPYLNDSLRVAIQEMSDSWDDRKQIIESNSLFKKTGGGESVLIDFVLQSKTGRLGLQIAFDQLVPLCFKLGNFCAILGLGEMNSC